MGRFARRRAALCLRALCDSGVGTVARVDNLVEWLGACVAITRRVGATAEFRLRKDGGAAITLPTFAHQWDEAAVKGEECGHYLCSGGWTRRPVVNPWRASAQDINLDELREADEEQEAREFLEALIIPDRAVLALSCEADVRDLIEECPLGEEAALRRIQHVRKFGPERFHGPEPWSAWQHYRAEFFPSPFVSRLRILPRSGQGMEMEWPIVSREDLLTRRLRLYLDLEALRPLEFELRCAAEKAGQGEDADFVWEEFDEICRRRKWR